MGNLEVVEGKVFDVIGLQDRVIAQMAEQYLPLKIRDIEDKAGLKKVHEARMIVKGARVKVENKRKELKEDALRYGQAIDKEANRIKALIEPIESHLLAEETAVEAALEVIKQEAARKREEAIQRRRDVLTALGVHCNGMVWSFQNVSLPEALLKAASDEQWEKFRDEFQVVVRVEQDRQSAEEAVRKAEAERLAKIAAEQEAERQRLDAVRLENERAERERLAAIAEGERKARIRERLENEEREKKAAELRAEERRLADEKAEWNRIKAEEIRAQEAAKQKAIDDARHDEEMEKARVEAAERAKVEAEERIKREAEEKRQAEEKARIAAEKKAAKRPEREKVLAWVNEFEEDLGFPPDTKSPEAADIIREFQDGVARAAEVARDLVEELL